MGCQAFTISEDNPPGCIVHGGKIAYTHSSAGMAEPIFARDYSKPKAVLIFRVNLTNADPGYDPPNGIIMSYNIGK